MNRRLLDSPPAHHTAVNFRIEGLLMGRQELRHYYQQAVQDIIARMRDADVVERLQNLGAVLEPPASVHFPYSRTDGWSGQCVLAFVNPRAAETCVRAWNGFPIWDDVQPRGYPVAMRMTDGRALGNAMPLVQALMG